jgi:hypothetical protein
MKNIQSTSLGLSWHKMKLFASAILEKGQGLFEFLVILTIVSTVVMSVFAALGPSLKGDLAEVYCTVINEGPPFGDPNLTWAWMPETDSCVEAPLF